MKKKQKKKQQMKIFLVAKIDLLLCIQTAKHLCAHGYSSVLYNTRVCVCITFIAVSSSIFRTTYSFTAIVFFYFHFFLFDLAEN